MLPLLVFVGTIAGAWYLLIVRPQRDQQSRHGQLVERLTVGDHVLTVGGIYGRVAAVEGTSVVLELAPGLTSRIATAGIARIVHGAEAALPANMSDDASPPAALTTPRSASEPHMQHEQHPHQQHPAPQPASIALPPQPFTAAPTLQMPVVQQHQPQHAAPAPVPAPMHVQATPQAAPPAPQPLPTTFRAQVLPALPTFEPRPWGNAAPVSMNATHPHAPAPAGHLPPAPQLAAPVQVHAPFAAPMPQLAQAMPQPAPQPQQYAMPQHAPQAQQQYAMPQYAPQPPQQQYAMPQHAPQPVHYAAPVIAHPPHVQAQHLQQPAQSHAVAPAAPEHVDDRRHSRAPKGMGSTLRLDDPSLADTIARARGERSELADEYRKLTAPLVQLDDAAHAPQQQHQAHAEPQFVGHDPNGVPLFAMPGGHVVAGAPQYPGPARPEHVDHGMPRPVVSAPQGTPDPAFASSAFQHRTPYAPQPAAQAAAHA
ncbi:MAG: preprotein translocase, YajC subunit [Thermoleophilia bacterium]|nr:preprotein translocase, YajC subunit [Thermoleophilia bacterium]